MKSNDSPHEPAEHATDTPEESRKRTSWLAQSKDVLIRFLPSQLRDIVERGLLKAFLVLVVIVVVLPPMILLVAAFWVKQLGGTNIGWIRELRNAYLEVIYTGFSIEEVASRSNTRLDYFQLFEYDLRPKSAPSKEMRISIQPRQKAAIDFKVITFKADNEGCAIPEDDIELVSVSLGEQPVRTLRQESNMTIEIAKNWWESNVKKFDSDDLVQRLSFRLTEQAKQMTCGRIHIEGSVRVFKDLFPAAQS